MMGIQGEWVHRITGQKIHVRNSIIDGDQMIIITNFGQISGDEFMRNYVQASDEIYDENGNVIGKEKMQPISKQPPKKIETIFDQEYVIDDEPVKFDNATNTKTNNNVQQKTDIRNIDLIKKIFDKVESKPEITIDIKWDNFPKEQVSTLVNFLDIDISDISQYLYSKYVNVDTIKNHINEIINKNI